MVSDSKITFYDALCLDDLDVLVDYYKDKNVTVHSGLYIPNKKTIGKYSTYYEMWHVLLSNASQQDVPTVFIGSYWTEHVAVSPFLGTQSSLSSEEISVLSEMESELGIKKVLIVPEGTPAQAISKVAFSFSKKFPAFSGADAPNVYNAMMDLQHVPGTETRFLSSIVQKIEEKRREEREPLLSEKKAKEKVKELAPIAAVDQTDVAFKLEMANAISSILNTRIIRKQGPAYDSIDSDVRNFLKEKLDGIFQPKSDLSINSEDVALVKGFVQQLKTKMENRK